MKRKKRTAEMDFHTRLALLRFDGLSDLGKHGGKMFQFTDAVTGSSFDVKPGQCVGRALTDFMVRWEVAEKEASV